MPLRPALATTILLKVLVTSGFPLAYRLCCYSCRTQGAYDCRSKTQLRARGSSGWGGNRRPQVKDGRNEAPYKAHRKPAPLATVCGEPYATELGEVSAPLARSTEINPPLGKALRPTCVVHCHGWDNQMIIGSERTLRLSGTQDGEAGEMVT